MRVLKKRIRKRKKNQQFVSFYPRLDALAGTFEGYRNGDSCTSTSEKDLDYSSVYLTDCCMVAGDSLLLLKLLWPKYCYTLYNTIYTLEEEFLLFFTLCVHGWWHVHVALIENLIHSVFLCVSVCLCVCSVPKMESSTGLWVDSPLKREAFICIGSHGKKKTYRKKRK